MHWCICHIELRQKYAGCFIVIKLVSWVRDVSLNLLSFKSASQIHIDRRR
ncbi:Uncharacterised protein [Vibrio cholerae]|nr:Uncharacterised protein [Vibrio cholerae]CSI87239.1 Uncharacterised protein [Vibrio cholerae]